jgi:hypothetical protein
MIIVNAFNAYLFMMVHIGALYDFNNSRGKLSYELFSNKFILKDGRILRSRGNGAAPAHDQEIVHQPALWSQLPFLKTLVIVRA